jgi:predicted nucleic acid-binding Zn ribbon protein
MTRPPPPDECANCGADIPRNARACPECGADERTGWRETSIYDGLDLPDAASANEDADNARKGPRHAAGLPWYWAAAMILMLAILILSALGLSR